MTAALLQFLGSSALIVLAAVWLTRLADRVAEITGLGRLLVGMVLLASLTSLPEISVGISAALQNHPDIAVGNVVGSSLINLAILALLDLLPWSRGQLLSRAASHHALAATLSVALTALAALSLISEPIFELGSVGLGSMAILVTGLLGLRLVFLDERYAAGAAAQSDATAVASLVPAVPDQRRQLALNLLGCALAAVVILIVSPWMSDSAARLAELTGMGQTFVGSTLVAFATSLPEATSCLAAVRMRQPDLAIGNIFGSNGFNMLILAPVDMVSAAPLLAVASPVHAVTCLWAIVVTAVAILGQLFRRPGRKPFVEPDAWLMLLLIGIALASTWKR